MSERELLLNAILRQPDDDTARLVMADYLDENNESGWAGFIRRQIENANRDDCRSFARIRPATLYRYRVTLPELAAVKPWECVRAEHVNPMVVFTGGSRKANYQLCVGWHRGFPAVVGCTPREWHRHHYKFPAPVEALCFYRSQNGVWGTWRVGKMTHYQSMVSQAVPKVGGNYTADPAFSPTLAAFPNVQKVYGACSAALLYELSTKRAWEPAQGELT